MIETDTLPDDLQPWRPANAWTPQIGDRVRVRLSGECRAEFNFFDHTSYRYWSTRQGHHPEEDGQIGIVAQTRLPTTPDHPFWVQFDVPVPCSNGYRLTGLCYALAELEPAEATRA